MELCPRFGLDEAETETVAWLVRYHLLLSNTAFRRDLADPKTVEDFVRVVQSPERLRLLLILTVVDIRAVGPTTWNDWKRQLLRTLFDAAEERLAPRLQAARPGRAGGSAAARAGRSARLEGIGGTRPRPPPARQLLAGRTGRLAAGQRAPGRRGRSAHRRSGSLGHGRARRRFGDDPHFRLRARPAGPVLPDRRRAQRRRRVDRRCAHPHHARRHGARQSAGHRCARAAV